MCENLNTEVNTWTVEDANARVFIVIYARQGESNVLVNLVSGSSLPRNVCVRLSEKLDFHLCKLAGKWPKYFHWALEHSEQEVCV